MKSVYFSLALILIVFNSVVISAKTFEQDGVFYETKGNSVTVSSPKKRNPAYVSLVIPSVVLYEGKNYTVKVIKHDGFAKSPNLKSVVIPNTVTEIGCRAFADCPLLESVIVPDEAKLKVSSGSLAKSILFGPVSVLAESVSPFAGCVNLVSIKGNSKVLPDYVITQMLTGNNEVPFYANYITEMSNAKVTEDKGGNKSQPIDSFSLYVKNIIQPELEAWQARKEYESEEQWRNRVNEKTNKLKIENLLSAAQDDYIRQFAPKYITGILGEYDTEYEIYTITTNNGIGNLYAKVPESERENFSRNWDKVKINPVYGILNDKVGVLACEFVLGTKVYQSPRTYTTDNLNTADFGFKPMDSFLAENVNSSMGVSGAGDVKGNEKRTIKEGLNDIVDVDIPSTGVTNKNSFAVIIGNEDYSRGVPPVEFAGNDAKVFAKYCNKTLGVPEKNIRTYYNATYGDMLAAMRDIEDIAKAYKGKIKLIFYYAGHGLPDEETLEAYLLPVDADGHTTDGLYSLKKLYKQFSDLKAKETLVFLDACFSGSTRGDDMLIAARGIRLKPTEVKPEGNVISFSATSGRQTAFPYKEKGHGMFTYFLLDMLRQSKGDATMGDIYEYVFDNVSQQSIVNNRKSQVPSINVSKDLFDSWSSIKLK